MTATPNLHEWSKDTLFSKAQIYATKMHDHTHDNWEFGLWSSFTLEVLARYALASTSICLLADNKDWESLAYAIDKDSLGFSTSPKSISITEVFKRLLRIHPETFTKETSSFCMKHMNYRNEEVHTGSAPFITLGTSKWLAKFYIACEIFLKIDNKELGDLFSNDIAEEASKLISEYQDNSSKKVLNLINAHKTIWNEKDPQEKEILTKQAITTSTRHTGHRVKCPACSSIALIQGTPIGKPVITVKEDEGEVVEKQSMIPTSFECVACGLKFSGISKLNECELGDSYTSTNRYEAADYFDISPEYDDEYYGYMEDNNE